jgi:hypothetical protein
MTSSTQRLPVSFAQKGFLVQRSTFGGLAGVAQLIAPTQKLQNLHKNCKAFQGALGVRQVP